jgi:hypothetical protein
MPTRTKSLTVEESARARRLVQELVDRRYGNNRSEAAADLGVSQPTLSDFLNGNKGMGPKLLRGVAKVDRSVANAILGSGEEPSAPVEVEPDTAERDGAVWILTRQGVPVEEARALLDRLDEARQASSAEDLARLALLFRDRPSIPVAMQRAFAKDAQKLLQSTTRQRRRKAGE